MITNTIYGKSARFDVAAPLTNDELYKLAPSIFAKEAHDSRSERFRVIPTIEVLDGLRAEGFYPVAARQSGSRAADRREYTKHMIRLRRFDKLEAYKVGDNVCEIILKNANDGTSAYDLMAGMFRIRCMNSLVAQTATIDSVKIRHSGRAVDNVIEGTYRVLGEATNLLAAPQDWSQIKLDRDAAMMLAEEAHAIRFADAEGEARTPIEARQLLIPRRREDTDNDLWTTFNVIQENTIRGGLSARAPTTFDERGRRVRGRMVTTREVKGIDQDVRVNKALWRITEFFANQASNQHRAPILEAAE